MPVGQGLAFSFRLCSGLHDRAVDPGGMPVQPARLLEPARCLVDCDSVGHPLAAVSSSLAISSANFCTAFRCGIGADRRWEQQIGGDPDLRRR
jgi:hypothetical protein